jgi:hypothetical protein
MKKFLVIITFGLIAGYGIPSNGYSTDPCVSVEEEMILAIRAENGELGYGIVKLGDALTGFEIGSGRIARAAVKEEYPRIPAKIGCALGYWDLKLKQS